MARRASQFTDLNPDASALIFDDRNHQWSLVESRLLRDLLSQSRKWKACIIFTEIKHFRNQARNTLWDEIVSRFPRTPPSFWTSTGVLHNGFFGCDYSLPPATEPYSTYFRLSAKMPENQGLPDYNSPHGSSSYEWMQMGFLTSSGSAYNVMVCFDVPEDMIAGLQSSLPTMLQDLQGPYALHIPLLDQLVHLYDTSIWYQGGTIKSIEKELLETANRRNETRDSVHPTDPSPAQKQRRQLAASFEIASHVAHLVETTQIATETIDRMRIECESFAAAQKLPNAIVSQRSRRLGFLHSMLRGLSARAVSNEKRLTSGQALLSNLISLEASSKAATRPEELTPQYREASLPTLPSFGPPFSSDL